jgi:hypothetical protein
MRRKVRVVAFAIATLLCFGIFILRHVYLLAYKPVASISIQQIQVAIQKSGGEEILIKEAARAILRYNNGASSFDIMNCPAITRLASIVEGKIVDIIPDGADGIGVPATFLFDAVLTLMTSLFTSLAPDRCQQQTTLR